MIKKKERAQKSPVSEWKGHYHYRSYKYSSENSIYNFIPKYDNVDEMDIFLGKDNLSKLTEGIENLINPIAIKEI